jgi:prepilin-type N-terminal cleavage/methylation domain-containing protein
MKEKIGFTILEIMVVVILIGIIASFAIPNFNKAIAKSHERDMVMQLTAVHAANQIYNANSGDYWNASTSNLATINANLGINIVSNDGTVFTYTYGANDYTVDAAWGGFTVRIDETPISGTNPSCQAGTCPSL